MTECSEFQCQEQRYKALRQELEIAFAEKEASKRVAMRKGVTRVLQFWLDQATDLSMYTQLAYYLGCWQVEARRCMADRRISQREAEAAELLEYREQQGRTAELFALQRAEVLEEGTKIIQLEADEGEAAVTKMHALLRHERHEQASLESHALEEEVAAASWPRREASAIQELAIQEHEVKELQKNLEVVEQEAVGLRTEIARRQQQCTALQAISLAVENGEDDETKFIEREQKLISEIHELQSANKVLKHRKTTLASEAAQIRQGLTKRARRQEGVERKNGGVRGARGRPVATVE